MLEHNRISGLVSDSLLFKEGALPNGVYGLSLLLVSVFLFRGHTPLRSQGISGNPRPTGFTLSLIYFNIDEVAVSGLYSEVTESGSSLGVKLFSRNFYLSFCQMTISFPFS